MSECLAKYSLEYKSAPRHINRNKQKSAAVTNVRIWFGCFIYLWNNLTMYYIINTYLILSVNNSNKLYTCI